MVSMGNATRPAMFDDPPPLVAADECFHPRTFHGDLCLLPPRPRNRREFVAHLRRMAWEAGTHPLECERVSSFQTVPDRRGVMDALRSMEPELRACGARKLYLFGSVARGDAGFDSDIDVAVSAPDLDAVAIFFATGDSPACGRRRASSVRSPLGGCRRRLGAGFLMPEVTRCVTAAEKMPQFAPPQPQHKARHIGRFA